MAPEEHTRAVVQTRLAEAIGLEATSYLMAHLPPQEWSELATKADLREWAAEIRKDIAHQSELVGVRFDAMDVKFDARLDSVDGRFAEIAATLMSAIDRSASTLRLEMINQTRTMVVALATIMVALVGALVAVR